MIKLKNIRIDDNILMCLIFPEDCETAGTIKVDASNNEIIDFNLPKDYEWCKKHLQHAKDYLIRLYNSKENIPKEKIIMWY